MIEICGETITTHLSMICSNIIQTCIYSDLWKYANFSFIKCLTNLYLVPVLSVSWTSYTYLQSFITILYYKQTYHIQPIRFPISATCQLLHLVNLIHSFYDRKVYLEFPSLFLDISEPFDKGLAQ